MNFKIGLEKTVSWRESHCTGISTPKSWVVHRSHGLYTEVMGWKRKLENGCNITNMSTRKKQSALYLTGYLNQSIFYRAISDGRMRADPVY